MSRSEGGSWRWRDVVDVDAVHPEARGEAKSTGAALGHAYALDSWSERHEL